MLNHSGPGAPHTFPLETNLPKLFLRWNCSGECPCKTSAPEGHPFHTHSPSAFCSLMGLCVCAHACVLCVCVCLFPTTLPLTASGFSSYYWISLGNSPSTGVKTRWRAKAQSPLCYHKCQYEKQQTAYSWQNKQSAWNNFHVNESEGKLPPM